MVVQINSRKPKTGSRKGHTNYRKRSIHRSLSLVVLGLIKGSRHLAGAGGRGVEFCGGQRELTNLPGHLWRDKWTALSGPLSGLFPKKHKVQREEGPHSVAAQFDGDLTEDDLVDRRWGARRTLSRQPTRGRA